MKRISYSNRLLGEPKTSAGRRKRSIQVPGPSDDILVTIQTEFPIRSQRANYHPEPSLNRYNSSLILNDGLEPTWGMGYWSNDWKKKKIPPTNGEPKVIQTTRGGKKDLPKSSSSSSGKIVHLRPGLDPSSTQENESDTGHREPQTPGGGVSWADRKRA